MENNVITPIKFGALKNETHVQYGETVDALIVEVEPGIESFDEMYVMFVRALANEKEALDFIRKSGRTGPIWVQDDVRDKVFRGFADTVKALSGHFDPAISDDAREVAAIFKFFGNISRKTFDDKTAAISDLLTKLSAPALSEAIDRLKINNWVTKLDEENKQFHKLMMERYRENAGKTPYRMSTARKETDRYYHAMVSEIENYVLRRGITPKLKELIDGLNVIVARFDAIIAQEKGRSKK